MRITTASLLVELNISVWTATVTERKVTDQVIAQAKADITAGQFKKNLMAGTTKRKEIADFAQGCRHWHMARTLPWLDKGGRLLPMTLFLDYKREIGKRKEQFEKMVDEFLASYDDLVDQAKAHLGDMFNPADYPPAEHVRSKFGFRLVFSPVPEANDFRIQVAEEEMQELTEQYEEQFNRRIEDAMRSSWDRLHEMLTGMVKKLTDEEDTETKKRYHDTLLGNAHELCAMLTHLNVTKDPDLERARRGLEEAIFGVDMDDIRIDPGVRADVKGRLEKVLGDFW